MSHLFTRHTHIPANHVCRLFSSGHSLLVACQSACCQSDFFCVSNSLILSNILDARVGDFTHPQVWEVVEYQLVTDAMCESLQGGLFRVKGEGVVRGEDEGAKKSLRGVGGFCGQ